MQITERWPFFFTSNAQSLRASSSKVTNSIADLANLRNQSRRIGVRRDLTLLGRSGRFPGVPLHILATPPRRPSDLAVEERRASHQQPHPTSRSRFHQIQTLYWWRSCPFLPCASTHGCHGRGRCHDRSGQRHDCASQLRIHPLIFLSSPLRFDLAGGCGGEGEAATCANDRGSPWIFPSHQENDGGTLGAPRDGASQKWSSSLRDLEWEREKR